MGGLAESGQKIYNMVEDNKTWQKGGRAWPLWE